MGDLTVARLDEDRFWLTGSYYLQAWHQRWFRAQPPGPGVDAREHHRRLDGLLRLGPGVARDPRAADARRCVERGVPVPGGSADGGRRRRAVVGRLSLTGELGYEIVVAAGEHRTLWRRLRDAGAEDGLRPIGDRAVDSLRLEKGYGIWNAEFTQARTPGMSGLDRFVAFDKGDFIGREAALREREGGAARRLVLLDVAAADADASGHDGIWLGDRQVGVVTSGAYGHHVGKSLALAYVDRDVIEDDAELTMFVVGEARTARILSEPPYDPTAPGFEARRTWPASRPFACLSPPSLPPASSGLAKP